MKRRTLMIILLLFIGGCKDKPYHHSDLGYYHVWCEKCQDEHICTYLIDDGVSFTCGSDINYRDHRWNEGKYEKEIQQFYGKTELREYRQRKANWEIIYLD